MSIITLEDSGWYLELDPTLGGSVLRLQHRGVDVLRPATEPCSSPLDSAAFPLLPFVGRIDQGRFSLNGQTIVLGATPGAEPHALHGHGWLRPWRVESSSDCDVTLSYEHKADTWPWSYRAQQEFLLGPQGFSVFLSLANLSDSPMPAGLGWHSYFPKHSARLHAPVSRWWPGSADLAPTTSESIAGEGRLEDIDVELLEVDNAFLRANRLATIAWQQYGYRVTIETSEAFGLCLVYTPVGENFFCFEPVSQAPNAVNSDEPDSVSGLRWLASQQTLTACLRMTLETI